MAKLWMTDVEERKYGLNLRVAATCISLIGLSLVLQAAYELASNSGNWWKCFTGMTIAIGAGFLFVGALKKIWGKQSV